MVETRSAKRIPGEYGLWIFLCSDLLVFGLYFVAYAHDYSADPAMFSAGKASLVHSIGLINTLLLLTGSWAVALAVNAIDANPRRAGWLLGAGALSGAGFLVLKAVEYSSLFEAGHSVVENRFYIWYFVLTAFHAFHVLIGLGVLAEAGQALLSGRRRISRGYGEVVGCYWHMVDLIWIAIFALII